MLAAPRLLQTGVQRSLTPHTAFVARVPLQLLRAGAAPRAFASQAVRADERFPSYVLNAPATEVSTLKNGVRVASEVRTRSDMPSVCYTSGDAGADTSRITRQSSAVINFLRVLACNACARR